MPDAPQPLIDELLAIASAAAREAGAFVQARFRTGPQLVATKSSPTDMVTEVDRQAEALIVRRILAARPDDTIEGEEGGQRPGTSAVHWSIDPLDGTTNFVYGFPAVAVSVAALVDGVTVAGAVFDVVGGQLFSAAKGGGAFLEATRLALAPGAGLATALVGTGFGYDAARRAAQGAVVAHVLPAIRDIRRSGSAALDLCCVAAGRYDAFFETGLQPWDRLAGLLIIEEAGGAHTTVPATAQLPETVVAGRDAALVAALAARIATAPRAAVPPPG